MPSSATEDRISSSALLRCAFSPSLVPYDLAMAEMMNQVNAVSSGDTSNLIWFLQHSDVYTAGVSADSSDILDETEIPVLQSDRGGKHTYHGPGQLIIYPILDLNILYGNKIDVRKFVADMSLWIIASLKMLNVDCFSDEEKIGIWTHDGVHKKKIASLGFKIKKCISYHGMALNICTDMANFYPINPCGLSAEVMSSLHELGHNITIDQVTLSLIHNFLIMFGITQNNLHYVQLL